MAERAVRVTQREPEQADPDLRRRLLALWAELLARVVLERQNGET